MSRFALDSWFIVILSIMTSFVMGCNQGAGVGGDDSNDNGGSDNNGNDGGQTDSSSAIIKTQILLDATGKIDLGDDLLVYGITAGDGEGVYFITPSSASSATSAGTFVPGSDLLFGKTDFEVAGKKIALVRSTNAVSIYDTESGSLSDIATDVLTLDRLMDADGQLIAAVHSFPPAVKVIDVSGNDPVIIECGTPDGVFGFSNATIDAENRRVAADNGLNIYVWDLDAPELPQVFETLSISSQSPLFIDGDYVLYLRSRDFDTIAALLNITNRTLALFEDLPSAGPTFGTHELALEGGSFGFLFFREDADEEESAFSSGVYRSAIGTVSLDPEVILANQLATFDLRPTTVDNSTTPPGAEIDCAEPVKRIGYGSEFCITPDGSRIFLGNSGFVRPQDDYIQMSTGGAFTDFADPEGNTVTGSLAGTDPVCGQDFVAFRGIRQFGTGNGCGLQDDLVLSFIILDRLD